MFKKLLLKVLLLKWLIKQKFKKKEYSVWDDWYLNSSRPYIWDREFLNKNGEKDGCN